MIRSRAEIILHWSVAIGFSLIGLVLIALCWDVPRDALSPTIHLVAPVVEVLSLAWIMVVARRVAWPVNEQTRFSLCMVGLVAVLICMAAANESTTWIQYQEPIVSYPNPDRMLTPSDLGVTPPVITPSEMGESPPVPAPSQLGGP